MNDDRTARSTPSWQAPISTASSKQTNAPSAPLTPRRWRWSSRSLRSALSSATVAPVVDSTRTAAMAAALAEFDAIEDRAADNWLGARTGGKGDARCRPAGSATNALLTGAAAAAVVGVLGIAAPQRRSWRRQHVIRPLRPRRRPATSLRRRAAPSARCSRHRRHRRSRSAGARPMPASPTFRRSTAQRVWRSTRHSTLEQPDATPRCAPRPPPRSHAATEIAAPASLHVQPACLGAAGYLWLGDITVRGIAAFAVRDATGMLLAIAVDDCRSLLHAAP